MVGMGWCLYEVLAKVALGVASSSNKVKTNNCCKKLAFEM